VICIVPLAGPAVYSENGQLRQLELIDGLPLFHRLLSARSWQTEIAPEHYIFVLRAGEEFKELKIVVEKWYPKAKTATISTLTKGALLSALAGLALVDQSAAALTIDLVDIDFSLQESPSRLFAKKSSVGGLLPVFKSDQAKFSYAKMDGSQVLATVEKKVISDHASAGVYFFRDSSVFLKAAAHSLTHEAELNHKGLLFLCPAMNGVIASQLEVLGLEALAVHCY